MKGVKPFIVFSVLQLVLLRNPCDGQFHWGKNYRLEANTLANLLLGNEDSADENMKVSFVSNRLTLKRQLIGCIRQTTFTFRFLYIKIQEEGQEPAIVKVDSSSNDPLDPIRSFLLTRNLRALENSPLSQTLMKSPRLFKPKNLKKSAEKDRLFHQTLLKPRLLKKSVENDLMYQSYMRLCRYSGTCRFFH